MILVWFWCVLVCWCVFGVFLVCFWCVLVCFGVLVAFWVLVFGVLVLSCVVLSCIVSCCTVLLACGVVYCVGVFSCWCFGLLFVCVCSLFWLFCFPCICSKSLPRGNQVDGLPRAASLKFSTKSRISKVLHSFLLKTKILTNSSGNA